MTWRVTKYVSRQGKGINRRNERHNSCFLILRVLTIILNIISFSYIKYWNCKKQFHFLHKKDNSVLIAVHYVSRRKWQLWEINENLQPLARRIARNIPGVTWHKTQMSPDYKRTMLPKFLRKSKVDLQKSCPNKIAGWRAAF